ncbi:unnamed protein product [Adineta steineri]|uniref:Uncharacterized protein n=1 Tax=Adineta steineri TaxID=433720 RepID=A0A816EYT3_9BILA|nr:unnamed protein product [Adineta steineri]CAF1505824.1 unnamed protein product [Adineta steineri]CAF1535865.1 unnamed protein product [Adineta steineri]CAF1655485.1 unnamed protein product [Adineta steineri]
MTTKINTASSTGATTQKHKSTPVIQTATASYMSTIISTMASTPTDTSTTPTCTTFITFDDISDQSTLSIPIPNGYKNLNWINAEVIQPALLPYQSGYPQGVCSPPFVMHNPTGEQMIISSTGSNQFFFNSLYITSAWRNSLIITMITLKAGQITSTKTITAMTTNTTYVHCSLSTSIDTILLLANGGIPMANFTQNGTQFVIDNLCITFEN